MELGLVKKTACILKTLIHGTCEKLKKEEKKEGKINGSFFNYAFVFSVIFRPQSDKG